MIVFTKEQITEIEDHASATYPKECCGILLGTRQKEQRIVREIYRAYNASAEPQTHFVLTSDTILYAEILATKENLEIIGFYHSHPDCEACLSQEDQKYVMPEMSYPVISVSHGRMQKFGCWEQRKIDNREVIVHERIIIKRF
jgi:proteasome lid subunit RPN8/RPN11